MGFFSKKEKRSLGLISWLSSFFGLNSATGKTINPINSMAYSAVYSCVHIISETMASLPLHVYKKLPDGGKVKAYEHPLYELLNYSPNPEQNAFTWRELGQMQLLLWGNFYVFVERNGAGEVIGLYPMLAENVKVYRDTETNKLIYEYVDSKGKIWRFGKEDILHIAGMGFDGIVGVSPIAMAREAVAIGLASEEMGAAFFRNGANPSGVIEIPQGEELSKISLEFMSENFQVNYTGGLNSGKIPVLPGGAKFVRTSIPPNDAQWLETRKFQLQEVARIFRVPLHMVGDLSGATFSNIEQQSLEYFRDTILPWSVRWEQAITNALLTKEERKKYEIKFNVDGIIRSDIKARYNAYNIGRNAGFLSVNEIREKENMNPIPNGDTYLSPLNMQIIKEKSSLEGKE